MAHRGDYKSLYVPSVQFEGSIEKNIVIPFIKQKLRAFFQAQEGIRDLNQVQEIGPQDAITDMEWTASGGQQIPLSYVYEVVMEKALKQDGNIHHIAYTLTYDHDLTPDRCKETGTYYNCMTLAGTPILYYIRLNLPEILAEVRKHASHAVK